MTHSGLALTTSVAFLLGCATGTPPPDGIGGRGPAAPPADVIADAQDLVRVDAYRLTSPKSLLAGYPATSERGALNVVVEIPTGTNAKWEVDKQTGDLTWEIKDGEPRVVRYLGYPGNYGMVPRTLLPEDAGGDGDPLDVLVLGPAVARGSVVEARLIGVLRLLDGGEQDDKLLAVMIGSPLGAVISLAELEARFAGVTTIIETWFTSYKGPGETVSQGFGEADEAQRVLDTAIAAYAE